MCRDLVYDDVLQRDEPFFVWQCGATELVVQQTLGHQPLNCQNLLFVSNFPKPSFVLVRLAGEVPEDAIELLHVFLARSRSLMLLISAAYACFSDHIS